jgi:hypothetical protein
LPCAIVHILSDCGTAQHRNENSYHQTAHNEPLFARYFDALTFVTPGGSACGLIKSQAGRPSLPFMPELGQPTSRATLPYAALAAAIGLYFGLVGLAVLPIPGSERNLHGPHWLIFCVGLAFFLAGCAMFIQVIGHASETGDLPPGAPRWMRVAIALIGFTIFVCFGLMTSWVAFGPGERHFSGSFGSNATIGRAVFGFGAVVIWLGTIVITVSSLRKLLRSGNPTQSES